MQTQQTENSVDRSPTVRLIALVQQLLVDNSVSRPISLTMRLSDLGITSIQMVQLMLAVEAEFDLTIPPTEITPENFYSIDSMTSLILKLRPA